MVNLIILRGYPGSGKTTVGKVLEKDGFGVFIDHNAILTYLAGIVGNDNGIYEEIHALEKAMASKVLNDGKTAIVARGFCSNKKLVEYTAVAESLNVKYLVFTLVAPFAVLEQRVQSPERKIDYNPTVNPKALHDWVLNNPIETFDGEKIIDASQPLSEVISEIKQQISV